MRTVAGLLPWALLGAVGCSEPPRDDEAVMPPTTAAAPTGAGTGTGMVGTSGPQDADASSESSEGPDTNNPLLDVGPASTDGYVPMGCDKIDFLFVVDNSDSMRDHQTNLRQSFPGFIDAVQATLEDVNSLHVGVVTTDAYGPNSAGCDDVGGLVTRTGGTNSSQAVCGPYAENANYMTEADDLADTFSCAAQVGTDGASDELPVYAMVRAVVGDLAGDGECNQGFLRDDALLVIVFVTDCGTFGPPGGEPQDWYDLIVAARGFWQNVVVVSVIETSLDSGLSERLDGRRIAEFTELFGEHGLVGDIEMPDYSPLLSEAVDRIRLGCDEFIPPG